MILAFAFFLL